MENIEVQLGEDHLLIREAVRKLCAGFPQEYWRAGDANDAYPTAFIEALTDAGLLAALIPEEFGGTGLGLRAAAVILEEINAAGCVANQGHAQMYIMGTLLRHGSEEQKMRFLPDIAAGRLRLQAFAVTEPTTGSDTTQIKTFAKAVPGGYSISGQKVWTSRALHSDLMLLLARTTPIGEVGRKTEGISVFLVDLRESVGKGLEIRPLDAMINHNTTELFFNELFVPADGLIGEEGRGFRYILDGMNAERILVASEAVGDGRWFLKRAAAYTKERVIFGRPIGQNQGLQFPLARAYAELEAADLAARAAAALFEHGQECGTKANVAKLLASEAAWRAAETAMQCFGGFGFAREYDIERKWRECRLYQTAPISTNLILSHIAQHELGLPRSY